MTVCVVGSFMMDLLATTPRLPVPGETVIGRSFGAFLGGKGFNQAVAARRSGALVRMVGTVGDDSYGNRFLGVMEREGIETQFVRRHRDLGTGVGLPRVDDAGRNSIVVVPRANLSLEPGHLDGGPGWLAGVNLVLLQLELPLATVARAASTAKAAGCQVVLNPAPAAKDLTMLRGLVDVVVPNEVEAATVAGTGTANDDPVGLARAVAEALDSDTVVLTLGGQGVVVVAGSNPPVHKPAHDVTCVDSLGAGDAFCGALAASLARGDSLLDGVSYANAAGALAVTKQGGEPSMPAAGNILDLMARQLPTCPRPTSSPPT